MEGKKKFESPLAIIIEFTNEDIITSSGPNPWNDPDYQDWVHGGGGNP